MVAPVREVANKHFLFSSAITSNSTMAQIPSNTDMDVDIDMIRGRSALPSRANLRSSSISLSTSSIPYHQCMELNNDLPDTVSREPIDNSQLSYTGEVEVGNLVRLASDKDSASDSQCVYNETPALKKKPQPHGKNKGKTIDGTSSSPSENVVNSLMTLIRLWCLTYRTVISILSLYVAQWNTLCQMLKILRTLFIA